VTRLLGVDLGERRIGLALAEPGREPAAALMTVPRGASLEADVARLRTIVAEQRIGALVVGLPLEARGTEGPMADAARAWASAIAAALGLPVTLRDERLSSHVAEGRLGRMPRGRAGGPPTKVQRDRYRARVDREAAAIILQDELDARAAGDATAWDPGIGGREP
jgi:putative Holliday junction resolvase